MVSVEDEWEREMESDEDLDLLFVAHAPDRISVETILQKIQEFGFDAKVQDP